MHKDESLGTWGIDGKKHSIRMDFKVRDRTHRPTYQHLVLTFSR